jgi:hypothetical protein
MPYTTLHAASLVVLKQNIDERLRLFRALRLAIVDDECLMAVFKSIG